MNINDVSQNPNIDTRQATFGPGTIITGAVNHITTPAAPPSFKVEREDTRLMDTVARFLSKRLTELQVQAIAAILGLLGIGGAASWSKLAYSMWIFIAAILFLFVAVLLLAALRHKRLRQCPSCHEDFALVEGRGAQAFDVDARDGTHRTITRPYDCAKCGHHLERESSEVLSDED